MQMGLSLLYNVLSVWYIGYVPYIYNIFRVFYWFLGYGTARQDFARMIVRIAKRLSAC
jgi:hypothetical protein